MINVIDIIGNHSGMNFYDLSYKKIFNERGYNIRILSNFKDEENCISPFFKNMYKGQFAVKIAKLIYNTLKLACFMIQKRKEWFIYQTYGTYVDAIFILIVSLCSKRVIIDVHDSVALDSQDSKMLNLILKYLYTQRCSSIIYHSNQTLAYFSSINFGGQPIFVPHFKYVFPKIFHIDNISVEVKNSIKKTSLNFLFFGHIRKSKGIDLLIDAMNSIDTNIKHNFNFIIAGNDTNNLLKEENMDISSDVSISLILRFINTDELAYLYKHVDYIILPYKSISQSGVLEMAIYFRTPVITSDLVYFQSILNDYTSFGQCFRLSSCNLKEKLENLLIEKNNWYTQEDIERYYSQKEIDVFFDSLKDYIEKKSS
jgi:Glycosyltransferase